MGERQYLFIDFEFTMPESKNNPHGFFPEIIEVGVVCVNKDTVLDQFSTYVQPIHYARLSERCKKFLQISQKQIDAGISFHELIRQLKSYEHMTSSTIVTWGNMDMRVLKQSCTREDVDFPFKGENRDLSLEYKRFFGDQNQTGLWKAVQAYGKQGEGNHHRALDDALTTKNIFDLVEKDKEYLKKPQPTTIGERVDFAKLMSKVSYTN
ncbi:MAG: 3'-5' exonuclease KapD [Bacilli bacterium]